MYIVHAFVVLNGYVFVRIRSLYTNLIGYLVLCIYASFGIPICLLHVYAFRIWLLIWLGTSETKKAQKSILNNKIEFFFLSKA